MVPHGGYVLSTGMDPASDAIAIWIAVHPEATPEPRTFYVRGTGHHMNGAPMLGFIGTVINEPFVWHVFEGNN